MKSKIAKKIGALALCAALILPSFAVYAYELPHAYWALNDRYGAAVNSNDYNGIIESGTEIINLISNEPKNEQTGNIIGSRAYNVAFAYYYNGDYQNAARYFDMYIPYGREFGWDDGVIIAQNFVKQLTSSMEVYEETDIPQKTYGEKNEPRGVLYGQTSERTQPVDSMILLYLEYGDTYFTWARHILGEAAGSGKAVELALNFPNEGTTARSVSASDEYLTALYSLLSDFDSVPVYLRIGAEFNIWDDKCTPSEFISAYRAIAGAVAPLGNVSCVWSMAHTSTWGLDANAFYPGDEYVDWVGVNCYPNKYFQARRWNGEEEFNEICFKTGYSADPVLMIKDVVDTYGERKPIMIAECGSSYRTNGSINENHDDWAAYYLRQMYSFIPMVYPQVKMIAYFNTQIENELCYYDLDGSSALKAAYDESVKSPWFIQKKYTNSADTFFRKCGGTITVEDSKTLYTYPHLYGSDYVTVDYYLDGNLVKSTNEVPYKAELTGIKGTHTLTVTATGNNGASMSREYKVVSYTKAENADDFTDTASLSPVQKDAVNYVVKKGIMSGYEDNSLKPDNTITRAEFATMMCLMMGYEAEEPCTFDDAKNHWGSKYIQACVKADAIHGMGDNKFAPDSNITLEQAVTILTLVYGFAASDASYPDGFMAAANTHNMPQNLTSDEIGSMLKRIDAAMLMYNAGK